VQTGASRRNDGLEKIHARKTKSVSSASADPAPIDDRTRTEEPGLLRSLLKANSRARASVRVTAEGLETPSAPDGVVRSRRRVAEQVSSAGRRWGEQFASSLSTKSAWGRIL
jgi:hypothetical protein